MGEAVYNRAAGLDFDIVRASDSWVGGDRERAADGGGWGADGVGAAEGGGEDKHNGVLPGGAAVLRRVRVQDEERVPGVVDGVGGGASRVYGYDVL